MSSFLKDAAVTTSPSQLTLNSGRVQQSDGASGQLMQVNGSSVGNLDLSSHSAWQYLKVVYEYDCVATDRRTPGPMEIRLLLKDIH